MRAVFRRERRLRHLHRGMPVERAGARPKALRDVARQTARASDGSGVADTGYGNSRPLKRLIQQEVENPLARRILAATFVPGDQIWVDTNGEVFTFEKTDMPVPV